MGTGLPLLLCCSLGLFPATFIGRQIEKANKEESNEAVAQRSVNSMFLEGVLFESGKSEIYTAALEFSKVDLTKRGDIKSGYVIEYLYPDRKSIKATCFVQQGFAWAPRNRTDLAHSWYARVPTNRQGIGYRIIRAGKVVSEHRFTTPTKPIQIECDETPQQTLTWRIQTSNAEIAVSYDQGKSWQVTPAMRVPAGTIGFSSTQLRPNPHPWVFLQGSSNGVIYTKLHVFGLLHPS